jgi:hypothetical protein
MLWIMRTGAPWEDLPEGYGSHKTVSSRFYRWRKAGIWDKILAEVQKDADTKGQVEWELHFIDSSMCVLISMLLVPEGHWGQRGEPNSDNSEALGRSQGGFSTKIHVRCEGKGKPVVFELTPGEAHESTVFEKLMEGGAIKKPGRGRPRRLPF